MEPNIKDGTKRIYKRRRRTPKPSHIEILPRTIEPTSSQPFGILGVTKLVLSGITQKIVKCVVGEDVTAEDPWTYVKKEILEDNIDLHEDSSEFLPIAMEIKKYPEKEILVGWIPAGSKKKDYFYVVYDIEAKEKVIKTIEKQKIEMDNRLQRSIHWPVGSWSSLGSEKEVNQSQSQCNRPLFEIKIDSKFPLIDRTVHFKLREVKDTRDGYVELLPDPRYPIINVELKRTDASVQAALQKVNSAVQTIPPYPKNAITQYEYLPDLEESREQKLKIRNQPQIKLVPTNITFTPEMIDKLTDTLYFNGHVNLYGDDYGLLAPAKGKRIELNSSAKSKLFLSLSEVQTTKKNVACHASWCSFKSGIVAVCYAQYCFSEFSSGLDASDAVNRAAEGACPVLLWSYDDGLKPKLYLQTPREVFFVSFCPFKENILVGGCRNGQIIMWDITNKLEQVETQEILTHSQQRSRENLWNSMNWMKNTYNIAEVQPVLISATTDSHTLMVTAIQWLNPKLGLTRNGKWSRNEDTEHKSLSFISFGIDGSILVWDLPIDPPKADLKKPKRQLKRLARIPSALTYADSDYNKFQSAFKPYFKIIVKDNSNPVPILSVVRKPNVLNYVPIQNIDPHTNVRTEYALSKEQASPQNYPLFVTTTDGRVLKLSWEGYDFAPDQKLNTDEATLNAFHSTHDGPILSCHVHPVYDDCLITVGGKIFAIWNTDLPYAILCRKAGNGSKYMSASWTYAHSSYISALRSDGAYEIWDLNYSSKFPTRVVYLGGEFRTKVLGTLHGIHARKGTFGITDNMGSFNIYELPPILRKSTNEHIKETKDLLEKATKRKLTLLQWMDNFEETSRQNKEESAKKLIETIKLNKIKNKTIEKTVSEVEKMEKIFSNIDWDRHTREKCEILFRRKNLNLPALKQLRQPLLQLKMEKQGKLIKLGEARKQKDKILSNAVGDILKGTEYLKDFPHSIESKQDYNLIVADYKEIEEKMLWMIYTHPYTTKSTFIGNIEGMRAQQQCVNVYLNRVNIRSNSKYCKSLRVRRRSTRTTVESSELHTESSFSD